MIFEYGNENVRFKYREIEGASKNDTVPSELILDGQQRMTSIYSALYNTTAITAKTDTGDKIKRYYIHLAKMLGW